MVFLTFLDGAVSLLSEGDVLRFMTRPVFLFVLSFDASAQQRLN